MALWSNVFRLHFAFFLYKVLRVSLKSITFANTETDYVPVIKNTHIIIL